MAIKIAIPEDTSKTFTFTSSGKALLDILDLTNSVLPATSGSAKAFFLVAYKKKVYVVGTTSDTFLCHLVDGAVSTSDGAFGFQFEFLSGILKGRADMSFTFNGAECEFALVKGKYNGNIVILPISADQANQINSIMSDKSKTEESNLPADVLAVIREGIAFTNVKDVFQVEQSLLVSYLSLTSKGFLTVSSFDQHHFGHYKNKVAAGGLEFRVALPSTHFLTIDKVTNGGPASFYIHPENIKVVGDNFVLILPSTQVDEKNFSLIPEYIKALDTPDYVCTYDTDQIRVLADNLFTLHAINTAFELSAKEKSSFLNVAFTTQNGTASDSLKVAVQTPANVKVKIDPRVFRDILALIKGQKEAVMSIKTDKVLTLKTKTRLKADVTLVGALVG